jgi:hypothetical protein
MIFFSTTKKNSLELSFFVAFNSVFVKLFFT